MAAHDYSPRQALDRFMEKVGQKDPALRAILQSLIDAGKDVEETIDSGTDVLDAGPRQGGRRKRKTYRKTVPLTEEEALRAILDALEALFIEDPLFTNSANAEFEKAGQRPDPSDRESWSPSRGTKALQPRDVDVPKTIDVELQPETQISAPDQKTLTLSPVSSEQIREQQAHLERLRLLFTFD